MPSFEDTTRRENSASGPQNFDARSSTEKSRSIYADGPLSNGVSVESVNISHKGINGVVMNGESLNTLPNGRSSKQSSESERKSMSGRKAMPTEPQSLANGTTSQPLKQPPAPTTASSSGQSASLALLAPETFTDRPRSPSAPQRYSSPPSFAQRTTGSSSNPNPPQLKHRHTLQVPKLNPPRTSREVTPSAEDTNASAGRFSPTTSGPRRASVSLGRRVTRSIHSDMHLEEVPQDEDAARWAEAIRQKRASKRKRKEDEDEDRVVVGTKVDQNHVNWVTAYNMLTGIRFVVSRTNAKMDKALTSEDFDAKHKFAFDVTGTELTPSAKYDFKFKDYAPWVFRHLRARFNLDPADYLVSLTSKYILSELGSPGKSGSFFYFSRDYKYIIKTIHHAEHKFLRKILRDYYEHVENNPDTLLSQFYGLHRVKIPYGRKIHFVVMNNLFPPHRDIHQTFDLKGSTIGRNYKEEDLVNNPRATLKDLNWLRRDLTLEFGPTKKTLFVEQMERDVKLLQRLKIMDYSLLVGIHDLTKGNEENLRDRTLAIFQPGGPEQPANSTQSSTMLTRTPSKLETARKARELRAIIKKEKPVPMGSALDKMPDQMLEERKHFTFYGDDGGFQATHEDDQPGEEVYYLGIIDCLTHYGIAKKAEHLWKGLSHQKSQISPIPPEPYGDRFVRFITSVTQPRGASLSTAALPTTSSGPPTLSLDPTIGAIRRSTDRSTTSRASAGGRLSLETERERTARVLEKAERQARKSDPRGTAEDDIPERKIGAVRSPSAERTGGATGSILPVVEEAAGDAEAEGRRWRSEK
ncbi:MAG: Phosphatidylinositol-4-phosphate 5-kinase [Vezdaea aestivalis]|nr:MAG: Phosphatidylinositol-4-phosphate 5-kinase [Vezdaea aestivalis]